MDGPMVGFFFCPEPPAPRCRVRILFLGIALLAGLGAPSCVMRETVRDSHGDIIYQETVRGSPFESEARRDERILRKEDELGL